MSCFQLIPQFVEIQQKNQFFCISLSIDTSLCAWHRDEKREFNNKHMADGATTFSSSLYCCWPSLWNKKITLFLWSPPLSISLSVCVVASVTKTVWRTVIKLNVESVYKKRLYGMCEIPDSRITKATLHLGASVNCWLYLPHLLPDLRVSVMWVAYATTQTNRRMDRGALHKKSFIFYF